MSEALLEALNPRQEIRRGRADDSVLNVAKEAKRRCARRGRQDRQTVKALRESGESDRFFPATVGSDEKPTPSGVLKVTSIDAHPNYRYNPDYKFKGVNPRSLHDQSRPQQPVGSHWIRAFIEGYGIHGTPNPSKVSKSDSHGCVRLTNLGRRLGWRSC
jgi:lipoprotein-anchoring transpeptidase ErfK/SrfK